MLRMALAFLVVALIAGLFGFGVIASSMVEMAKILFFVFLVLAVLTFIVNLGRGRPVDPV